MTLRLTEELDAELNTLATAQGTSKNQLIIAALEDYLARQTHEFRAKSAIEATLSQHAGLIDKLSRT